MSFIGSVLKKATGGNVDVDEGRMTTGGGRELHLPGDHGSVTSTVPRYDAESGKYYLDLTYEDGFTESKSVSQQEYLSNGGSPNELPKPSDSRNVPTLEEISAPINAARGERADATQGLVDRYSAVQLDTGPADQAREQQQQALGMQQAIYDKLMGYDPQAEANAASKRAMSKQLAISRSAPGGAAARQAAQFQALQSAPAIQAQAAETANEQAVKNTQLAAQAAAGFANTASGTRAQDISQAQAEVDTGLSVANGIAQVVGHDIQLTSDEARFLGQAQIALEGLNIDWAQLDETQRASMVDEAMRKAGLEQQWKMFKEEQKVDALDVIGAITGTARSAVGTYASGKQAGLWG